MAIKDATSAEEENARTQAPQGWRTCNSHFSQSESESGNSHELSGGVHALLLSRTVRTGTSSVLSLARQTCRRQEVGLHHIVWHANTTDWHPSDVK